MLHTILKETYAAVDAIVGSRSLNDATEVSFSAVVVGIDCCNRRSVGCRPSYWSAMNQVLQYTQRQQPFYGPFSGTSR